MSVRGLIPILAGGGLAWLAYSKMDKGGEFEDDDFIDLPSESENQEDQKAE